MTSPERPYRKLQSVNIDFKDLPTTDQLAISPWTFKDSLLMVAVLIVVGIFAYIPVGFVYVILRAYGV